MEDLKEAPQLCDACGSFAWETRLFQMPDGTELCMCPDCMAAQLVRLENQMAGVDVQGLRMIKFCSMDTET